MIRVRAPSRLHFGFLSLPPPEPPAALWPDRTGFPVLRARRFGSVGLMVEAPGVCVATSPAAQWSASGPLAERALAYAGRVAPTLGDLAPQRLVVERAAPEHAGLGTGTQLGLAVAQALATAAGQPDLDVRDLARRVGRGRRSGIGVHGFARGGFLVDAGRTQGEAVAPLAARVAFPESWRVVLVVPSRGQGVHGRQESRAFEQLGDRPFPLAATEALCRLVLLGMLPALAEEDLEAFGEALYDFNARVGDLFVPVQGGTYAGRDTSELVAFLRGQGFRAVGQSSWGPTVFAVAGGPEQAEDLVRRLRERFRLAPAEVIVTRACNRGAETEATPGDARAARSYP